MKKFLSLALVFVLVLVTLTSCDFLNKLLNKGEETTTTPEETTPPAPTYDVDAAATYLDNLYKEGFKNSPKTTVDFDVVSQIIIDGLTYTVEWTVDTDKVTVGEAKDGKDMDDRIGYIHDALKRLEHYFGLDEVEHSETLQKDAVKDGEKKQEDFNKKDGSKDKGDK